MNTGIYAVLTASANTGIYAVLAAFLLTAFFCRLLIPSLIKFKFGQQVREDGPKHHISKTGTPTMGGISFIIGFILAGLFFGSQNPEAVAIVVVTFFFGLIGFFDDFIKIRKKRSLGLRAYQKILCQLLVSVGFLLYWRTLDGFTSEVLIPFGSSFDLRAFFPVLVCLVFISSANGANLTDGLDGLASGVTVIIALFFMAAAIMFDSGITPAIGAMVGGLLGFLLFNSHPAKVYMGDTGSLALGGFVAAVSLVLGMPIFLLIVAIIYVIESLSVLIQVAYFKMTGGKRFFKMAPIHHSFELSGWKETKIVALFMIVTSIAVFAGFLAI